MNVIFVQKQLIPELEFRTEICRVASKRRFVKMFLEDSKLASDDWVRRNFSYVECAFRSIELLRKNRSEFYGEIKKYENILDEIIDETFGGRVEMVKTSKRLREL